MSAAPPRSGYYPDQPYYAPGWQAPAGPPPRRRGAGRIALVTALVALAALVLGAAVVGLLALRDTRPLGEVTEPVTASSRRLDVGHCLAELPGDGPVGRVRVVPCTDPHAAEVVDAVELRDGPWPGAQDVQDELTQRCTLSPAEVGAGFQPVVWAPSQAGWGQGDRRGLCLAWTGGSTVRGTVEDAAAPPVT